MWDNIPGEIWIQILIKLPVKTLIRAASVCKAWRSLIRSPSFTSAHLSNTENQAFIRRLDLREFREHYTVFPKTGPVDIKSSRELEVPFVVESMCFRILGSCDGLVCLYNVAFSNRMPVIWNPAIRNQVVLPQSLIVPTTVRYHYVFGFGVASNVHKVVKLIYYRSNAIIPPPQTDGFSLRSGRWRNALIPPPQAEVFSLQTGRWRILSGVDVRLCPDESRWDRDPVFFKGFVHWIAYEPTSRHNSILTFHVGDEVFGEIMLPEELEEMKRNRSSLAVTGESLGAINSVNYTRYQVWMMKDYGVKESWTKLYSIDNESFQKVVGFWGSGAETLLAVLGRNLVTYNAQTKGIKNVEGHGESSSGSFYYLGDYKESLVLLGGYRGDPGEELSLEKPVAE